MDELQQTLRATFLEEAVEVVENLESSFLEWEADRGNTQVIDRIFRLAHNLKGSSKAVGFLEIGAFTHDLESLMLKVKNGEIAVTDAVFDLLLKCNDEIARLVSGQRAGDDVQASTDLRDQMRAACEGKLGGDPEKVAVEEHPGFEIFQENMVEVPTSSPIVVPEVSSAQPTSVAPFNPPIVSPVPEAKSSSSPPPAGDAKGQTASKAQVDDSIRVSLTRVDTLVTMIGELVILQTVLNQQRQTIDSPLIQRTIVQLGKITKEIQDTSMGLRMIALKPTFQKMQRIVRDTAKSLGKEIDLQLFGEDTELDKAVVDQLGDPLVHLIRNACDHAIETPEERTAAGKSTTGKIRLSASHQGGKMVIEIADDGRGLDAQKLLQKAMEKGLVKPSQKLSESDCHNLIFAPGFSTKAAVTDLSGRGVGMDVVKTNVEKGLKGEVLLSTEKGKGTTFRIVLPLTLAIIDAMIVRCEKERFVVPLAQVHESLSSKPEDVHKLNGLGDVLSLRGENLPMYKLGRVLGLSTTATTSPKEETAIVVRTNQQPFAIVVDEIMSRQQVVIKRLGVEARVRKGIIGGAVLGDGSAALILDLAELTGPKVKGAAA